MSKQWTNYEVGQRIEATDAIQVAVDSPVQTIQSLLRDFMVGDDQPDQNYVARGFTTTNPSGTTVTVANGVAVVGFRRNGRTEFGMLSAGGAASKSSDLSGLADGTYGVYVRFEFVDSDFANRFFWNPLAVTPAETPKNVATRLSEDWNFTVDLVTPGPEWIQVASVVKTGAALALTDTRRLFFDTLNGTITDAEWGTSPDRASPVTNLRDMVMALARQIQDITGNSNWKTFTPTDLTTLPTLVLLRDGTNTLLSGATLNWVDDTGVIGDAQPVDSARSRVFEGANEFEANAGSERAVLSAGYLDNQQAGPVRALVAEFAGNNDTGGGVYSANNNERIRIYASGNGLAGTHLDGLEVAFNCAWDQDTSQWRRDQATDGDSTQDSNLVVFGGFTAAITVYRRTSGLADTWADSSNPATGWEQTLRLDQSGNLVLLNQMTADQFAYPGSRTFTKSIVGTATVSDTSLLSTSAAGSIILPNGTTLIYDLLSHLPEGVTLTNIAITVAGNPDLLDIDLLTSALGTNTTVVQDSGNSVASIAVSRTLTGGQKWLLHITNNEGADRSLADITLTYTTVAVAPL